MNNNDEPIEPLDPNEIENINRFIYKWVVRALEFDTTRSLQLNTFLLNYFLIQNYFPSIEIVDHKLGIKNYSIEELEKVGNSRKYIERAHGMYIMLNMLYQYKNKVSKGETDRRIAVMDVYENYVNGFFSLNINKKFFTKLPDGLLEMSIETQEYWLPYLNFDPEFNKILESDAFTYMFNINTPKNHPTKPLHLMEKYPIKHELIDEFKKAYESKNYLFQINPDLPMLPKFVLKFCNYLSIYYFGSLNLIREFIELFKKYYVLRIPSKKEEINGYLDCFEKLFAYVRGKFYVELTWRKVSTILEEGSSKETANSFMDRFCLEKDYQIFPEGVDNFKPMAMIKNYYKFLQKAMFYHMGIIRTGAVIIWRAMIKYFEDLQTINEFRILKGKLLENWCYDKAIAYGFESEKIVLLNKDRESDDKYNELLEQIKDFPKEPLILEASFPEDYPNAHFREIDLAIRLKHMIYFFECKGTVDPLSHEKEIYKWGKIGERHLKLLASRIELLNFFIDNRGLSHKFFEGATGHLAIIIQSEGLFEATTIFSPEKFVALVKDLRRLIDENKFDEVFSL